MFIGHRRLPIKSFSDEKIPAAYDGIDSDSAPDAVSLTRAPVVHNLLVDSPGLLPMRGPINAAAITLSQTSPLAFWSYNDNVLVGFKASGTVDPWTAPVRRLTSDTLAVGSTTAAFVSLVAGTETDVTVTRDTAPGPRSARIGASVYGPAYDSAAVVFADNGGLVRPRKLLKWGGTAAAPTAVANAPDCSQDALAHLQRLWVLGGRDQPSGSPAGVENNTLYYSIAGGPTVGAAADWKDPDPVTGLATRTNKIVVGSDDQNDFGVGLAKANGSMVILKRRSMYVLSGYDPTNFTIKQFFDSHGCLDARSICQWENGCFFLAEQGFMYFDGTRLLNTTSTMRSAVVANALSTVGDLGIDNGYAVACRLPNDYIALCIGVLPSQPIFAGLYHVPRQAWCTFSSNALPTKAPFGFGRGATIPYLIAGSALIRCDKITAPLTAASGEYGLDRIASAFTWPTDPTKATFSGTSNSLKNLETGAEMFPATGAGTVYPIKSKFVSRLFPMATPFYGSQLHRVMLDYMAQFLSGPDDTPAWQVTVLRGDGTVLEGPYQVAGQGNPTAYPNRRRDVHDVFSETTDVQLVIEWPNSTASLKQASILSAAIEFIAGAPRHSE